MKHNVDVELISFNGQSFTKPNSSELGSMTLKDALLDACINVDPQMIDDGEKKIQVFKLVDKIYRADPMVDLSAEDVSLLKKLVGKRCTVPAVGAIYALLENPRPKPEVVRMDSAQES